MDNDAAYINTEWVEESKFGKWFLRTDTWLKSVVQVACNNLEALLDTPIKSSSAILDIAVGTGVSLPELDKRFSPRTIVGVDIDPDGLKYARNKASRCKADIQLMESNANHINLPDASFDVIFCHQSMHHFVAQEQVMAEVFRLLKPGGKFLLAESTRAFIHSWPIKVFFRHPMHVQKTADEYLQLVRNSGLVFTDNNISYPYTWWSRWDIGITQGILRRPIPKKREETLINLVASKPYI